MKPKNLLILHEKFEANLHTPTSVYLSLQSNYSFLLESANLTHMSQYSLMGSGHLILNNISSIEEEYTIVTNSPLHFITHVGYLSYDLVQQYHNINYKDYPVSEDVFSKIHSTTPKSQFIVPTYYAVYDHVHHLVHFHKIIILDTESNLQDVIKQHTPDLLEKSRLIKEHTNIYSNLPISLSTSKSTIVKEYSNISQLEYESNVVKIKQHIKEGDIFQCVYARQVVLDCKDINEFQVYCNLRQLNPSPYMYYMQFDDLTIVGCSPELLCKIEKITGDQHVIISHPIAGTRPRGKNKLQDEKYKQDLLQDQKELAEHAMLVDLARNDIGRVIASPNGTDKVTVTQLNKVEYFSHVMHIVSEVQGTTTIQQLQTPNHISNQLDSLPSMSVTTTSLANHFHVIKGLFPAGTLSGAPKIKAMSLINQYEPHCRSIYGGLVGYINGSEMDSAIAIRTIQFLKTEQSTLALIQAGAGIVADSVPSSEYMETSHKMKACLQAIQLTTTSITKSPTLIPKVPQVVILKENCPQSLLVHATHILDNPVLIIDNYDSFTYNVYHLIDKPCLVLYNDTPISKVTALTFSHLIISPGPGTPADSGISKELIIKYQGKLPILGICLGHQLICTIYNGSCIQTTQVHGKTSSISHSKDHLFESIPSPINCMRYHSLLGIPSNELVVTCTTNSLIMGCRHPLYTIQSVQFHPESISTEFGQQMMTNFLALSSGEWPNTPSSTNNESILLSINNQVIQESLIKSKQFGHSMTDYLIYLENAPPSILQMHSFKDCTSDFLICAEMKRASPSQGLINTKQNPLLQSHLYYHSGASLISILTESTHFKGQLQDLLQSRLSFSKNEVGARPLFLRKDFITTKYQLLESRLYGADCVLLIAAVLCKDQLVELLEYCQILQLIPLIEIHTDEELQLVRNCVSSNYLLGINTRNLHTFKQLDQSTLHALIQSSLTLTSNLLILSNIKTQQQVIEYQKLGVHGVLIGQTLMQQDPIAFIKQARQLLKQDSQTITGSFSVFSTTAKLVKLCGISTKESYLAAQKSDLIGFMLTKSCRQVSLVEFQSVTSTNPSNNHLLVQKMLQQTHLTIEERSHLIYYCRQLLNRPLHVVVFNTEPIHDILKTLKEIKDMGIEVELVQIHGYGANDALELIPYGRIQGVRSINELAQYEMSCKPPFLYILDGKEGGSGEQHGHWDKRVMVAGGINKDTELGECCGIDVSSGIEVTRGIKDIGLIKQLLTKFK